MTNGSCRPLSTRMGRLCYCTGQLDDATAPAVAMMMMGRNEPADGSPSEWRHRHFLPPPPPPPAIYSNALQPTAHAIRRCARRHPFPVTGGIGQSGAGRRHAIGQEMAAAAADCCCSIECELFALLAARGGAGADSRRPLRFSCYATGEPAERRRIVPTSSRLFTFAGQELP